jgi:hypothetical protein
VTEIDVDIRCSDWELRRLQDGFTAEDHLNFTSVLLRNYVKSYQDIHVETGSLRGSGEAEVDRTGDYVWEGHISYGGASLGVKNPVRYAVSELFGTSPRYGGPPSHDYLKYTQHIDDELIGPITTFTFRGHRTPHPEGHIE